MACRESNAYSYTDRRDAEKQSAMPRARGANCSALSANQKASKQLKGSGDKKSDPVRSFFV